MIANDPAMKNLPNIVMAITVLLPAGVSKIQEKKLKKNCGVLGPGLKLYDFGT